MRRASLLLAALGLAPACAGGPLLADYRGPAVAARPLVDGGLRLAVTAPNAGYGLTLESVTPRGAVAEVRLRYEALPGDLFAQVLTELVVEVPSDLLGDARAVAVLVAAGEAAPGLALRTARPPR